MIACSESSVEKAILQGARKLGYLEGLYPKQQQVVKHFLSGSDVFVRLLLHVSTLARSLYLFLQLLHSSSKVSFELCCSYELSVAAAAQLRFAGENSDALSI